MHPANSQYWMQRGGGTTIDEGMDIASDGANNTYTTGYFTTNATFDNNTTVSSAGLDDIFIAKTNSSGNLQWVKRAGGLNIDKAISIDADNAGNFVITGFYYATADFGGQSLTAAGLQDAFVAKYDASGTLIWVKNIGGTGSESGNSIVFDNTGNVIVTGEFSGTCSFGPTSLTSQVNSLDVFTAKYDNSGNLLWAKKGSGTYTDRGTDVSTDASGNIYVSGMFSDTITFDLQHNNPMYNAMFVIKYNASGAEQWFRWMGSGTVVNMGGIAVHNNDVNITGNFNGTLYFFGGVVNPSLTSTFSNDIFVCRFDLSGNVVWSHADGSSSEVNARAIGTNSSGEVIVGGNFKCRFSDYSLHYGDGIFCSIGYWDSYVGSYDNSGNWMWGRHYGGRQNDYLNGLAVRSNNSIAFAGSYEDAYYTTTSSNFASFGNIGDVTTQNTGSITYCLDNNYKNFVKYISYGNSDIIINANLDLNREPYDYFRRAGAVCDRPFNDICIYDNLSSCQDTLFHCGHENIGVNFKMWDNIAPSYKYLWSDGSTNDVTVANTSGYYHVSVTSTDGCFTNKDTVYFVSWPVPPDPLITDSKGININALNTQNIPLCLPDSVVLTCTNVGTNSVQWNGFSIGQNPVTVNTGGNKVCTLTNQFGCIKANDVTVITGNALPAVQPFMLCLQDSDKNDTIQLCLGTKFTMYLYDQLSNPGGNTLTCFPGMYYAKWTANAFVSFNATSSCNAGYSTNLFQPIAVGSFDVLITSWIIRSNPCDTDSVFCSKQLHVIVHPVPSGNITISIAGPTQLCPGDTIILVASPDSLAYYWTGGQQNDTIYVTQAGFYQVTATQVITNSFGCSTVISGSDNTNITLYPQPAVTMIPANGLICPYDSVNLICTGTGNINWQGPNGNLSSNLNSVYVNTPGSYYAIQTVAPGCDLISNTVQVIQYNIPLIVAFPGQAICNGNPVILTVVTNPGSIIQWQTPLIGDSISQTVYSSGTYHCTVTSCGIVTPLSFTVFKDSAYAQITGPSSLSFCSGDSIRLTANPGMHGYLWLPTGDTLQNTYASQTGTYYLITSSIYGCRDTANINVTSVQNTLIPPMVSDTMICAGDSVILHASGIDTIRWSSSPDYNHVFNSGNTFQTPATFTMLTYYLFTESGECKSDFDSVRVFIDEHCNTIVIPNIFTPNGDGLNDYFPDYAGFYKLDIKIYNRWGSVIYEGSQKLFGWDGHTAKGTLVSDGTYYYVLSADFYDGTRSSHTGFVMVIAE